MKIFEPSRSKRFLLFIISDTMLFFVSLFFAFLVHFDFSLNIDYLQVIMEVFPFFLAVKLVSFGVFRIYQMTWRYVGISDLVNIIIAVIFACAVLVVISLPNAYLPVFSLTGFPKRIFLVDAIISIGLIGGLRISKRIYLEVIKEKRPFQKGKKRVLIVGAGNTGEMILRDMVRQQANRLSPVGMLDDNPSKLGSYIHGVKVLGTTDQMESVISKYDIESLIIAIPRLNWKKMRALHEAAKRADIDDIKIVPRIFDYDKPDIQLKSLEEMSVEDMIGRQVIEVDYAGIRDFISGRTIMITGAGGSIGSEIVIQVCSFKPGKLILFDIDETDLHNLGLKMARLYPNQMESVYFLTGDVRDRSRVQEVLQEYRPHIIFHAAAYKHVPMMEVNPKEAVKVNIFGTYTIARAAKEHGVEKFIMISTDKAVRPTSIMGATKRIAEEICKTFNNSKGQGAESGGQKTDAGYSIPDTCLNQKTSASSQYTALGGQDDSVTGNAEEEKELSASSRLTTSRSRTRYISVRFGNVLGSRGSVLPLFMDQLKHGGPLTVTHREMKRYFMTIPEAVSLVLQASMMGEGGEVFVLDMGEPVRISELAEELIRIHGLKPYEDVDIEFTHLRPGEKLFEEILTAEEGTIASKHEKVFIAKNSETYSSSQIEEILEGFGKILAEKSVQNEREVKAMLKRYVKHYEEQ